MFQPSMEWISLFMTYWLNIQMVIGKYCPMGYDQNPTTETCWKIETAAKNWFDAKSACAANGGKLGVYADQSDQDFIWSRWGNRNGHIWMGVNDLGVLGVHTDVDGNPLTWESWVNEGEKNTNGERCVLMSQFHLGLWGDYPCGTTAQSVCMTAEVTEKIYYRLESGSQLYRDEIETIADMIPQKCHILCGSTPSCVSVARNGTDCKLLKYGVTSRSFPGYDLYQ